MPRFAAIACAGFLTASLTVAPQAAQAQRTGKIPVIGYLIGGPPECPQSPRERAFLQGLRDQGFVPDQSITVDMRCHQNADQVRAVIGEFVQRKVDLIMVGTPEPAVAARAATQTIPIVCGSCGDPMVIGLAKSLARPGENFTGMASLSAELIGKRVELLREAVPGLARIALLFNPDNPGAPTVRRALNAAARVTGLKVGFAEFRALGDFDAAFAALAAAGERAVLIMDDPYTQAGRVRIGELATKYRMATIGGSPDIADAGALMAYGPSRNDLYRRAAGQVAKILKGAKAGDLPIEQPDKYDLVLNVRTARNLGLTFPPSLRLRAERMIE